MCLDYLELTEPCKNFNATLRRTKMRLFTFVLVVNHNLGKKNIDVNIDVLQSATRVFIARFIAFDMKSLRRALIRRV